MEVNIITLVGSDRLMLKAIRRKESRLRLSLSVSSKFSVLGVKFRFKFFVISKCGSEKK